MFQISSTRPCELETKIAKRKEKTISSIFSSNRMRNGEWIEHWNKQPHLASHPFISQLPRILTPGHSSSTVDAKVSTTSPFTIEWVNPLHLLFLYNPRFRSVNSTRINFDWLTHSMEELPMNFESNLKKQNVFGSFFFSTEWKYSTGKSGRFSSIPTWRWKRSRMTPGNGICLLHHEAFKHLKTLISIGKPKKPTDCEYKVLLEKWRSNYARVSFASTERMKFFAFRQDSALTLTMFENKLRDKATKCDFPLDF